MDIRGYLLPTVLATLLHVLVLGGLLTHWVGASEPEHHRPRHIQAQMIDLEAFSDSLPVQSTAAAAEAEAEAARQEARRQAEVAAKQAEREARAEAEAKAEAKRQAEAARAQAEKEARLKAEEARRQEQAMARQRAAEEAERKAQAQREAQEKARQEAAAKAQAEARAKAEAQARAQAEAKARAEAEAAARAEAEAARQQAAAQRAESIIGDIQGYIQALVQRNWRIPATARNGMEAVVQIRLFGNGEIDQASIVKSSGDQAFDRSALQAVYRTERFSRVAEVDPILFERRLRSIQVIFRPEGLRW